MKRIVLGIFALGLITASGWILIGRSKSDEPTNTTVDKSKPVVADPSRKPELTEYKFEYGNLQFKYPNQWNLVEGANNSDSSQIVTVESPKDTNGFYYCIDFNEYSMSGALGVDFKIKNTQIFRSVNITSSGIGKPLKFIEYMRADGSIGTTVVDGETVGTVDTEFTDTITNPRGRKLQINGRFNCREKELPKLDLETFQNSQLYQDGYHIFLNLSY